MARLLVIHDEAFLELAIQSAGNFIQFEERHSSKEHVSDLLAVIVMPRSAAPSLHSDLPPCEPATSTNGNCRHLRNLESISLDGLWLLITIDHPDLLDPLPRQEALVQSLSAFRVQRCFDTGGKVFPIIPHSHDEISSYDFTLLQTSHPDLFTGEILAVNRETGVWRISRFHA